MPAVRLRKLVLVVDDDAELRTLICKALDAAGYDTEQAPDGLKASEMLGTMKRLPDLLVCDVMMPMIDGFSLAKLVRTQKELKALPIVFLTAKGAAKDMVTGISLGAKHYLVKPISIKDLVEKVQKIL